MKTILAVLVAHLAIHWPAQGQLVLNTGDVFTFEFSDLPFVQNIIAPLLEGRLSVTADPLTVQVGDVLRYEMFETTATGTPICSHTATNFSQFELMSCNTSGAWQDRQGAIRLTMESGSVAISNFVVTAVLPYGPFGAPLFSRRVDLPARPVLCTALASGGMRLFWPTTAINFFLETVSALPADSGWQTVTNAPATNGPDVELMVTPTGQRQFYRLRWTP